jgi:hypothetical protein
MRAQVGNKKPQVQLTSGRLSLFVMKIAGRFQKQGKTLCIGLFFDLFIIQPAFQEFVVGIFYFTEGRIRHPYIFTACFIYYYKMPLPPMYNAGKRHIIHQCFETYSQCQGLHPNFFRGIA